MTTEAELYNALKYHVVVDSYGTRRYYNSADQPHRLDGPAVERSDGTKEWWLNGQLHRINGPAVEYATGTKEWWLNGQLQVCYSIQHQHQDQEHIFVEMNRIQPPLPNVSKSAMLIE